MNQHKIYMSEETAINAVRSYPARNIKFFGGEPLLRYRTIERVVDFANSFYKDNGWNGPTFSIVTNGSLITPEVAAFLKRNSFQVLVSMDGPKDVTDLQRPAINGVSSYDTSIRGIQNLKDHEVIFSIQATYTNNHIRMGYSVTDIANYIVGLGAYRAQVEPVFGQPADGFAGSYLLSQNQIEQVAREFKEFAVKSLDSMISGTPLRSAYVYSAIKALYVGRSISHSCAAAISSLTVDSLGRVYPCYFLLQDDFYMGNVIRAAGQQLTQSKEYRSVQRRFLKRERSSIMQCEGCWARRFCNPCYGMEQSGFKSLYTEGDIPEIYCAVMRATIEGTISKLVEIRRNPQAWTKLIAALDEDAKHHNRF